MKPALLADACEAVIAAIYLDGGLEAARDLIVREILPALEAVREPGHFTALTGDFKSALQERLQAANAPAARYRIVGSSRPDHRKVSRSRCGANSDCWPRPRASARRKPSSGAAQPGDRPPRITP